MSVCSGCDAAIRYKTEDVGLVQGMKREAYVHNLIRLRYNVLCPFQTFSIVRKHLVHKCLNLAMYVIMGTFVALQISTFYSASARKRSETRTRIQTACSG